MFSLESVIFSKPQPLIFPVFEVLPFLSPYQNGPHTASSSGRGGTSASLPFWQLPFDGPESWAFLIA